MDNDGAFELAQSRVTLPRDQMVRIDFTVRSPSNHHVSFLRVIDDKTSVVMQKIPLQTQAPDWMETLAPGVKRYRSSIPSHRTQHRILVLDPDVQAIRAVIEMPKFVGGEQLYSVGASDRSWVVSRFARPWMGTPPPEGSDAFTRVAAPGWVELLWENRGRREYESAYDPPAPEGPISAALTLTHYAVSFERASDGALEMHNRMADVTGRVEWLVGMPSSRSLKLKAEAPHGFADIAVMVPEKTALLHILVASKETDDGAVDVYAVDATGKSPNIVKQVELEDGQAEFTLASPTPGAWQFAIWAREPGRTGRYEVKTVALSAQEAGAKLSDYTHNSRTIVPSPPVSPDHATYAAFRIEPAGDDDEGVVIGLTPLSAAAF
jgi:hypothetical protein